MERARKQVPMSALGQERTSSGQVPMSASPQKRTLSLASPFAIDGQTILALTAPAQYSVFPRIFRKKLRVVRTLLVDVGRITSLVFVSCFSVNAS
jgi:hypothetical protein